MIIVSITGPRMSDALAQIASSAAYADMLEFRLDLIRSPALAILFSATPKPVIATCRPLWEGGGFRGREQDRLEILSAASLLGARYVDIELRAGKGALAQFLARRWDTQVIVSRHLSKGEKINALPAYRQLHATGADVVKFAFFASDSFEIRSAADFLHHARKDGQKAIAIAMGEAGEPSRVLYKILGAWATYAAPEQGKPSAPGQLTGRQLRELYRANTLGPRTRIFGVIGNPVRQSKGIFIHNQLFARERKNAVYCRFLVGDLKRFVRFMAPLLRGYSVTHPHKQEMVRFLDASDSLVKSVGAVNTVLRKRNRLWGTNTDAPGALDAIEHVTPVSGKNVLVVGAGGTACAIAFEARRRGARVLVTNRTESRGRALAERLGLEFVPLRLLGRTGFDVLVNATTVGMFPRVASSPVPARILGGKVVFDAVYNPPMTRLLHDALRSGARIVQGTEMYLNQAARQFQMYTGRRADITLMRKILRAD